LHIWVISQSLEKLTYWRTSSGYEVDAIIGEGRIAIEIKSTDEVKIPASERVKSISGRFSTGKSHCSIAR
jgi:uncharacterized protein